MEKEKPGPERFVTVMQFRMFEEKNKLNFEHFARVCTYEAVQPGSSLKDFLKKKILFGNCGDIAFDEIRDLAKELFLSERSHAYLRPLQSDNCMGYSAKEGDEIIMLLGNPSAKGEAVALLLGYIPPPRRY